MTDQLPQTPDAEYLLQNRYADILNEARVRIEGLNTIVRGTASLPHWLTAELIYLQLRLLCELMAVGCLVAHGDIVDERIEHLHKRHEPGAILKQLEVLHPEFFPKPITTTMLDGGLQYENVESGFLTKEQFLELYASTHDHLHRGSLSYIFRKNNPKQAPKIEDALDWALRLLALLNTHRIETCIPSKQFICFLAHEQVGGNALVVTAMSEEQQ